MTPAPGKGSYDYEPFSTLAGPAVTPGPGPYDVEFRNLLQRDGWRGRARLLVYAALAAETLFLVWLLQPSHYPTNDHTWWFYASMSMVVATAAIELMRLINVATLVRSTLRSADPVPVTPEPGLRVAFITTIVPGKEPVSMLRKTLEAATRIRHDGALHLWVLDEGDDPDVRALATELGVRHFTRKGIEHFNQEFGRNRRRTKHGNYNAWFDTHGQDYDFWISVDTDMVPLPNIAERLLGYFRDPDVAFVVGPQVYGNYDENWIVRASESQQFMFHGVVQRAGNHLGTAMFVGTNNAVRLSALSAIGGLQDSVTEDMATSLVWHSARNPETGNRWRSVYTPDVLSVGEGPSSWTDYFIQQSRWALGTNKMICSRRIFKRLHSLGFARSIHYTMLMSYYPSAALAWMLGTGSMLLYLSTGTGGIQVPARLWLMLFCNAGLLQLAVYCWNRRYNVSPHEPEGSSGAAGMLMSTLTAPIYVTALIDAIRNRNVPFKVTPKGDDASKDRLATFRKNLRWGGVIALALVASYRFGHEAPLIQLWAWMTLAISLLPVSLWLVGTFRSRLAARRRNQFDVEIIAWLGGPDAMREKNSEFA